jgi:alkylation response protein AidB-like acyl-CoA dehydrogenase
MVLSRCRRPVRRYAGTGLVGAELAQDAGQVGPVCRAEPTEDPVGFGSVVGIASYTKDLAPLEKIMRDAMVFPLYDGGNQGVRRRQLHDIIRHPGYDPMLAARGEGLPEDQ